jgi:hypothetical protein
MNSSISATTKHTPHELAYGVAVRRPLDLLRKAFGKQDFSMRIDAAEAISIAQMTMKRYYDEKHQPKSFQVGDRVVASRVFDAYPYSRHTVSAICRTFHRP